MAGQQGTGGVERPRKLGRGLASLLGAPVKVEDVAHATDVAEATGGRGRPAAGAGSAVRGGAWAGETPAPPEPGAANPPAGAGGDAQLARVEDSVSGGTIALIALDRIVPSPFQPRQHFDEAGLNELAASIRTAGVMQPVLVRRVGGSRGSDSSHSVVGRNPPPNPLPLGGGSEEPPLYELIAGERRWRAAAIAGLSAVPAIVVQADDQTAAEWALIENVQRVDLGPVERARAMGALADRFGLTHEQIGERLGMERASVSNHLRLLELEADALAIVERGGVTLGHAKVVLGIPGDGPERAELLRAAERERWSVRRLEDECRRVMHKMAGEAKAVLAGKSLALGHATDDLIAARARAAEIAGLEKRLMEHLGTRVRIITNGKGTKGRIVVEFYSVEGFEGVVGKMGVGE